MYKFGQNCQLSDVVDRRGRGSLVAGTALLVAIAAILAAAPARAQPASIPMVLMPASGLNVSPGILDAARDLLKDHLQRTGRYTVLTGEGASSTDEPTGAMAVEQATAVHAQQAGVLRLTHLGTSTRVRFTVYAASGQVVYWDSMSISGGPEQMDVVLERLVHAMVIGKPVRDSAELETVTNDEANTLNRRNANKTFGLHLFTLLPFNTPSGTTTAVPGVGLFWLYDARNWMADIALDLGGHNGSLAFDVGLGAYYPFFRSDFTPYLGGKIKYGYFNYGGNGSAGVSLEPTFGVLLGRTSSVQVRAEVGYFVDTFSESPKDTSSVRADRVSHGVALTVGLGF